MTALVLGAILSALALGYVLYPLFGTEDRRSPEPRRPETHAEDELTSPAARAIAALREIEFDRETGKLSPSDYETLKAEYTRDAIAAMRAESNASAPADDEVEAAILRYRSARPSCVECGPRPEVDAIFCSTCGRHLAGTCEGCGATIDQIGSRFCPACGRSLAA